MGSERGREGERKGRLEGEGEERRRGRRGKGGRRKKRIGFCLPNGKFGVNV